jgi:hypothetical protein
MPEGHSSTSDFNRALGGAKKQAAGIAGEVSDAAQDLYDQASDRASRLGNATSHAAHAPSALTEARPGASVLKRRRSTFYSTS